jgi:hypothetical protein
MRRTVLTLFGLAIVAGGAILVGGAFLEPEKEKRDASQDVLTGAYDARVEECVILEDNELPKGVEPPELGSSERYVRVVILFPGVPTIAGKGSDYVLQDVNGQKNLRLAPVDAEIVADEAGVFLTVVYKSDDEFQRAKLVRGEEVLADVKLG